MLTVKQGDRKPYVVMWLEQPLGTPIPNLDTATSITFKMRHDGAHATDAPDVEGACEILDVPTAQVRYKWAAGDTQRNPGVYNIEVEIITDTGEPLTVPTEGFEQILIVDDLDAG